MGIFSDLFKRNNELTELAYSMDFEDVDSHVQKVYLKRMALDVCANFIARAVSQSEIKINDNRWYYKLNVRPNTDMSAAQFWQALVCKMILDNRVLIVLSDSDDLLIADRWTRNEYAVYEDTFTDVTVKDFVFSRTFRMSEAIYLEYNNSRLQQYADGLIEDYAKLYSKMLDAAGRNNQIRGTIEIDANKDITDEKNVTMMQKYTDRLLDAFSKKSVAIAPLTKGFKFTEHSGANKANNITMDEVHKILLNLIDTVADALGIPTALLHGTRAELKDNMIAFYKFCLAPLLKKIEDELNAKLLEPQEYTKENRIKVVGINKPNIFELAEAIDKLISSSAFNPNEIREELGYDPREGGDEYKITKNLMETEETRKGGE